MPMKMDFDAPEANGSPATLAVPGLVWRAVGAWSLTNRGRSRPGTTPKLGLSHQLIVRRLSARCVEFRQRIENRGAEPLKVSELSFLEGPLALEGRAWQVMHSELFKCDRYFQRYNYYTGGLFGPLPGTEGQFGLSEDTPFPGVFFTHPERGALLIAVLSQDRFKPLFDLSSKGSRVHLALREAFTGVPYVTAAPGAAVEGEQWVALFNPGNVADVLDDYYRLLDRRVRFWGRESILRESLVWGTWNYNYRPRGHADVTHDHVVANARALTRTFKDRPCFVMIDDGYQAGKSRHRKGEPHVFTGFDIFHSGVKTPHDSKLFPHGMKKTAQDIAAAGALPAIWTTPIVKRSSSLLAERPDWRLKLEGGRQWAGEIEYLDYSLSEVRDYVRKVWDVIFNQWGYVGVKLDFWTMAFEPPQVRYRNRDRTAIELRNQFWQDARDALPTGGYLLTCCAVNGGNPFLGRHADASRMGLDMGDGTWNDMHRAAAWLSVVAMFYRGSALLGDPDTIGWCPQCKPGENKLWASMALATGGMCEIGGDLANAGAQERDFLARVSSIFRPALKFTPSFLKAGLGELPVAQCVVEREDGVHEVCMNWNSFSREFCLGKGGTDLWTGQRLSGRVRVAARDAIWVKR
ncbi:MAG TPA: alpha-galactosidase [Candidatus Brocadiia bacterium]|nr:alpha-galactosidase [Candidatus Brocadiia bacterium]